MENKLLLISDIHGRNFWKEATEKYTDQVDKVIMYGDEVDPYQWEGYTRKDAIQALKDVIEYKQKYGDKVILLWGNHALQYLTRDFYTRSRYDSSNAWIISELYHTHKSLWQLAYEQELGGKKYLFTHAGLAKTWYEMNKNLIGDLTVENLNSLINSPKGINALCDVSYLRGGYSKCGSIVWCDVRERYEHDEEVDNWDYQIFSHTQQEEKPIITERYACIDCRQAFLLNKDGILEPLNQDKGKEVEN